MTFPYTSTLDTKQGATRGMLYLRKRIYPHVAPKDTTNGTHIFNRAAILTW